MNAVRDCMICWIGLGGIKLDPFAAHVHVHLDRFEPLPHDPGPSFVVETSQPITEEEGLLQILSDVHLHDLHGLMRLRSHLHEEGLVALDHPRSEDVVERLVRLGRGAKEQQHQGGYPE